MKFILRLIGVAISIGLALLLLMVLINETFTKTVFKTDFMESGGIPIPRFVYKLSNVNRANAVQNNHFITLVGKGDLENAKNNYLNKLNKCYGIYYYDSSNEITITKYKIVDSGMYRQMDINYDYTDYCSDRYVLSDTWFDDYAMIGKIDDLNIKTTNLVNLVDTLKKSKRVINPVVSPNYKSEYAVSFSYSQKSVRYYMDIKDFSENEIVVIKYQKEKNKQFAVYEVENAKEVLSKLY